MIPRAQALLLRGVPYDYRSQRYPRSTSVRSLRSFIWDKVALVSNMLIRLLFESIFGKVLQDAHCIEMASPSLQNDGNDQLRFFHTPEPVHLKAIGTTDISVFRQASMIETDRFHRITRFGLQ